MGRDSGASAELAVWGAGRELPEVWGGEGGSGTCNQAVTHPAFSRAIDLPSAVKSQNQGHAGGVRVG